MDQKLWTTIIGFNVGLDNKEEVEMKKHQLTSFIYFSLLLSVFIATKNHYEACLFLCILFIADTWTSNQNIKLRFMC